VDAWGHPQFLAALAAPWNVLNTQPVIAAPAGRTTRGVPVGMQIIAGRYDDEMTFRVAHAYELATEPLFAEGARPGYRAGSE
jgi:Asp-tRNA(Asn)/Glu-tRNA(Gln) amidotransferase A subunit family amidase